ncbi:hypothetical protein [Bradyrhizobium sp. USDA 3364]
MESLVEELSPAEIEIVRRSLQATVEGGFFPDWEFETLIGASRDEVREVYAAWPLQTVEPDVFRGAVFNSMNNLIGYPHGKEEELMVYVPEGRAAMVQLLKRLSALGV